MDRMEVRFVGGGRGRAGGGGQVCGRRACEEPKLLEPEQQNKKLLEETQVNFNFVLDTRLLFIKGSYNSFTSRQQAN